jgi:hypothetical protein
VLTKPPSRRESPSARMVSACISKR